MRETPHGTVTIRRAGPRDIPAIEGVLLDAVRWLETEGMPLWSEERVRWPQLSRDFAPEDFWLAFCNEQPAGCMALIDHDPVFWPGLAKGESLFVHKLAVARQYAGRGCAAALLAHAKQQTRQAGIPAVRLDCHAGRPRLRAFYERSGFELVERKVLFGKYDTAFYACLVR